MENAALAIVIPALNRPNALKRLLTALDTAHYPSESKIPLLFALDQSAENGFDPTTLEVMEKYTWQHGPKTILRAEAPLGLRKNLLRCGQLTESYPGIIVLEDDLWVTPHFYSAAQKLWRAFHDHRQVGAISLYSFRYNEHAGRTFTPLHDHNDVFFMQTSSSWGQIWWHRTWAPFASYLQQGNLSHPLRAPIDIQHWDESWKKTHIQYLVEHELFTVVPRTSYTTNMGSPGKHHVAIPDLLQTNLATNDVFNNLMPIEASFAVYDAFFEPTSQTIAKLFPELKHPIEADLFGIKPLELLANKRCFSAKASQAPIKRYTHHLRPDLLNLHLPDKDGFFHEARGETLLPMNGQRLKILFDKDFPNLSGKDGLKHSLSQLSKKFFN